uniref:Uncharacterized protein n=1 Tax=Physcomitrium patens TaxID=3218 RepID=A0A2K1KIC8_PHYPA|nr:hypothetical protein PHYPA_007221 [Physcomitrium patens]
MLSHAHNLRARERGDYTPRQSVTRGFGHGFGPHARCCIVLGTVRGRDSYILGD